jgi:hypothetical protein
LEELERDLAQLKAEHAAVGVAIERIDASLNRLDAGDIGDPRAHLRAPDLPVSPGDMRLGRLAALWSAVSIGVLLVGLAILATFFPRILIPGALLLLGVYVLIDALFHRALESVVRAGAVVLALVTTAALIVQFFVPLLLVLVLLVGVYILVTNVRELLS